MHAVGAGAPLVIWPLTYGHAKLVHGLHQALPLGIGNGSTVATVPVVTDDPVVRDPVNLALFDARLRGLEGAGGQNKSQQSQKGKVYGKEAERAGE